MGKKKEKPQVINNIQELNLEIDYDKLAEAIKKANESSTEKQNSYISAVLAYWITLFFKGFSILCWIISLSTFSETCRVYCNQEKWVSVDASIGANIFSIVILFSIIAALIVYGVILWRASEEIAKEKNKNFVIAVFSAMVSFAALIVSLVALFKGVG